MSQGVLRSGDLGVAIQIRNRLLREAVAARIDSEPDLRVVGATECGAELAYLCRLRDPQIALFEITAQPEQEQPEHLVRMVAGLRARHRRLHLVGFYDRPDPRLAERLRHAGTNRVVACSGGMAAMLAALRQPAWDLGGAPVPLPGAFLTDRELRVLHLISSGYSREQVGAELQITPRTVENYKRRIFAKLHAHSQAHAVASGMRLGLLPLHPRPDPDPMPEVEAAAPRLPTVALLGGSPGPLAQEAARILLAHRIPLIIDHSGRPPAAEHPARHVRGALVVVLVDPRQPDWSAALDIPCRTVVVLSAAPPQAALVGIVMGGADAVLFGRGLARTLLPAFRLVEAGYQVLDARQARSFFGAAFTRVGLRSTVPLELTRREQQILRAIERGQSVKQTARALGISVKTVESLQSGLFRKLGTHTRAEALVVAHGLGLVPDGDVRPDPIG